jgi:CelD/BcsL family acetyltransferase involved in cellulose biosynthesis
VDLFRERRTLHYTTEAHTRAFLKRGADADAYLQAALSPDKQRDLRRKQKRLQEQGELEFRVVTESADAGSWIEEFLRLEASGWKGRAGTALATRNQGYFRAMASAGSQRDRVLMLGLFLNDRPIAMRCSFLAAPGSFFFKPAYDENYARFSPGVLLEVEMIRYLHRARDIQWMDSCTSPENDLLNKLWLDRRIVQTVVAATGKGSGRFAVSSLLLLRWLNRRLGRHRSPSGE